MAFSCHFPLINYLILHSVVAQAQLAMRHLIRILQVYQLEATNIGAKYLDFFSTRSLKTREKYISFGEFVCFLRGVCLLFNF